MSIPNSDWTDAERQEVFGEALHYPETSEEWAVQQEKFRTWLKDQRYRHLWPMLERLIQPVALPQVNGPTQTGSPVAS